MQITCPDCSSRYLVKPAAIGVHGRRVKCTHCGSIWFQEPLEPEKQKQQAAEVTVEPTETHPIPQGGNVPALKKQKSPLWHKLAFAVSLVVALIVLSYSVGHTALRAAPWLSLYYNLLDVHNTDGIGISDVEMQQLKDGAKLKLIFTGKFINTSDVAKPIPLLRVAIYNQDEKELVNVMLDSDGEMIEAGAETEFYNSVPGVSSNAARVIIDIGDKLSLAKR